jgi:hypothetical protein
MRLREGLEDLQRDDDESMDKGRPPQKTGKHKYAALANIRWEAIRGPSKPQLPAFMRAAAASGRADLGDGLMGSAQAAALQQGVPVGELISSPAQESPPKAEEEKAKADGKIRWSDQQGTATPPGKTRPQRSGAAMKRGVSPIRKEVRSSPARMGAKPVSRTGYLPWKTRGSEPSHDAISSVGDPFPPDMPAADRSPASERAKNAGGLDGQTFSEKVDGGPSPGMQRAQPASLDASASDLSFLRDVDGPAMRRPPPSRPHHGLADDEDEMIAFGEGSRPARRPPSPDARR